jgi:MFS family permease
MSSPGNQLLPGAQSDTLVRELLSSSAKESLMFKKNFSLLAVGQGISRLGDGLYVAALAWFAWALTHQLQAVALVQLASNLPPFIGSVIGASFADRYDRRRIMIGCDIWRALLVLPLPLLLHSGRLDVIGLTVAAVLVGVAGTAFAPARNALVPQIVDPEALLSANGILQVSFRAAFFVGPLLLPPLLALLPFSDIFYVDAATFVCSIVTLALMHLPTTSSPEPHLGLWADLHAGWQVLQKVPEVQS